jgi:hypothetical protein
MYLRNPIQSQTYKDIEYKQVIGVRKKVRVFILKFGLANFPGL